MATLNLTQRKSLRDQEPLLTAAAEKIKLATGQDYTFEFDFETHLPKCAEYIQKEPGKFFYGEVAGSIARCLASACADELIKEALNEANSNNKVLFRENLDKKDNQFWKYSFENGSMVITMRMPHSNISELAGFQIQKVIPTEGVFLLITRLSIKKNQEKLDLAIEEINKVTGTSTWNIDQESLQQIYAVAAPTENDKNRYGDSLKDIIEAVSKNIVTRCKDEMVKEAFNELNTNTTIRFVQDPKATGWTWSFDQGNLVIKFRSFSNINENSYYNFEKLL